MKLIFIYGLPATGKLTVAQELASVTGFKLFHNHLAVDLLLSVFDFGSSSFVRLREEIWLSVFAEASRNDLPGLIFTFAPEATVRTEFVPNVIDLIQSAGGEVEFIELTCPLATLKQRLNSPSRSSHKKLTSVELFEQLYAAGSLDTSHMSSPKISIDTSLYTPAEAAMQIAQSIALNPSRSIYANAN